MKVTVQDGCIVVSGWRGGSVRLASVAEVAAEKIGKITYDEVFLIVRDHSGNSVSIGELDDGFAEAETALRAHVPNIPADWRANAEASPVGTWMQVWPTA